MVATNRVIPCTQSMSFYGDAPEYAIKDPDLVSTCSVLPGPEGASRASRPGWRDAEQGGTRGAGLLQDPRTAAAREFHVGRGTTPATAPGAPPRSGGSSGPGGPQGAQQGGSTAPIVTAGSGGDGRAP